MKLRIPLFLLLVTLISTTAFSYDDEQQKIEKLTPSHSFQSKKTLVIEKGYIRETIPGTTVSSAYLTLFNNTNESLTLTGVTGDVSQRIELHNHEMHNGLMQMRQIEQITIPANEKVTLQPSGLHIMIFDLEKRLEADENVDLNLLFLKAPNQKVVLPVKSIKSTHH